MGPRRRRRPPRRDLNIVAPFITMFFMITYGVINIVVLIEQSRGLTSFRPQLKVPTVVPLVGAVGCIFAMFIINATVSLVAIAVVLAFYGLLIRRHLESPFADVRSGLFVAIAQWAAQKAADLPHQQQRAWKPNLLVHVSDPLALRGEYPFLQDLVNPTGYVDLMGIGPSEKVRESLENLIDLARIPDPEIHPLEGDFRDNLKKAPRCDLDIMGLSEPVDFDLTERAIHDTESSVLFVADSGEESALA